MIQSVYIRLFIYIKIKALQGETKVYLEKNDKRSSVRFAGYSFFSVNMLLGMVGLGLCWHSLERE